MNPTFSPIILLGGTGMIVVAIVFVVYTAIRRLGWAYLGLGALLWIVTVAVKFALAIPFNPAIYRALNSALHGGIGIGLFDLYVGLLTGVTEVGIVWLVLRYTRLGRVEWNRVLAFGVGFGTVEAFLLGVSSLLTGLTVLLAPNAIPSEALVQLTILNNGLYGIAATIERFFTVFIHIFANVLIFFAIAHKQVRWFWLSFAYKSLIDGWAAWGRLAGMTATVEQLWILEALVVLWGIVGWLGTRWIQHRYAPDATKQG